MYEQAADYPTTPVDDGDEQQDLLVPNPNRHYVPESSSEEEEEEDEQQSDEAESESKS